VALLITPSGPALAQATWLEEHGATSAEHQKWVEKVSKDGHRVAYVNAFDIDGSPRFIALAVPNPGKLDWNARHNLSEAEMQKAVSEYRKGGLRMLSFCGYRSGKDLRFGGTWIKDKSRLRPEPSLSLAGVQAYEAYLAAGKKKNEVPVMVTGAADGAGSYRLFPLIAPVGKTVWEERHDLTEAQYLSLLPDAGAKGSRPTSVTAYRTPSGLRMATTLVDDKASWKFSCGLSVENYQAEIDQMRKDKFVPVSVAGYVPGQSAGVEVFDLAMKKYMKEHGVKTGTLAVSRAGKLLLARGYGPADQGNRREISATDPMRIGTLSKLVTRAAVRQLIREGRLSPDTKAFPLLGLKPPPGQTPDPRLEQVTVRHLLDQTGGWDQQATYDPMFRSLEIAAALKAPSPAGPRDIIRYMAGQPLQLAPGSRAHSSNFEYCVLGRVIEKVSGETFLAYVKDHLLGPIGVKSVELGRSLPEHRNPLEPIYLDQKTGRNVFDPDSQQEVPLPDGGFCLEAMDACAGLVVSAEDLNRISGAYWPTGEPRSGGWKDNPSATAINGFLNRGAALRHELRSGAWNVRNWSVNGALPGTTSVLSLSSNEVNVAVIFNQTIDESDKNSLQLHKVLAEAAEQLSSGEVHYAAVWVKEG
jgi:CubicO group peptidase (beta-lactamase class C family)